MSDFTGERLIPGEVDADLWNEHISRYAFAASLCKGGERVIDAGCGTGYGSSYLSAHVRSVLGIDISPDAIGFATKRYRSAKSRFAVGVCEALPAMDAGADLIVAFEVIEHLEGWRAFLTECHRVLAPGGMLLVSTPNKSYYTESRGASGANPFHVHEFAFDEFSKELGRVFPHVQLVGQNHAGSIVFSTMSDRAAAAFASLHAEPEHASYFIAICGKQALEAVPNFVYVPEAANVLHERERHIQLLADELSTKDAELEALHREHAALVERHRAVIAELRRGNEWAETQRRDLEARAVRIVNLQAELADGQQRAVAEIERLNSENAAEQTALRAVIAERTVWAQGLDTELARCVALLHAAEQTIEERTRWAQGLDQVIADLSTRLAAFEASRWVKAGRVVRLGPPAA